MKELAGRQSPLEHNSTKPFKILVVEDDPHIALLVADQLEHQGHIVEIAETGRAGLGRLKKCPLNLLILDLSLPDINGFQVCARMKEDAKLRSIPVVILTADASRESLQRALDFNADHYVRKPVDCWNEFHDWIWALMHKDGRIRRSGDIIRIGDNFELDPKNHSLLLGGRPLKRLPNILFKLLYELAREPGKLRTRRYLVWRLWNNKVHDNELDVEITRVRQILKQFLGPSAEGLIKNVRGQGYQINPDTKPAP